MTALELQYDRISAIQRDMRRSLSALSDEDKRVSGEIRYKLLLAEASLAESIGDVSVVLAYLNVEGTKKCSE